MTTLRIYGIIKNIYFIVAVRSLIAIILQLGRTIMKTPVTFDLLDKKRSEGKPYRVYMMAAANKFLRIYYARVNEALNAVS